MEKGLPPTYKKPSRIKMIEQVHKRYCALKQKRSFKGCSTLFIATYAVQSPAPKFFISFERARKIIAEMRRGLYGVY